MNNNNSQQEQYDYFRRNNIHPTLRAICAGLAFHRPDSPLSYIQDCIEIMRKDKPVQATAHNESSPVTTATGAPAANWDLFITRPVVSNKNHRIAPLSLSVRMATAQHLYQAPVVMHKAEENRLKHLNSLNVIGHGSGSTTIGGKHFDRLPGITIASLSLEEKHGGDTTATSFALDGATPANVSRRVIFVLGGPGSGKGTQCVRLAKEFGLTHLSVGDLLRAEVATGSELGLQLNVLIADGMIVPMEITLRLLDNAMTLAARSNGFLIDGFPREMSQCTEFEKKMGVPEVILFFDCPLPLLESRLLKRGETSGRADDNLASIKKRFNTFMQASMPVVQYYEAQGKAIRVSSDQTVDEVFLATRTALEQRLSNAKVAESVTGIDQHLKLLPNVLRNMVLVLGGPGSGKGTQCDRIVEILQFVHLSTGDLLRKECAEGTLLGKSIESIMKNGGMVSMDITKTLLISAMNRHASARGFLLDGYPRTVEQAEDLVKEFGRPSKVIYYDCPEDILVQRLLERGKTSGRADDNLASIQKRITTFLDTTLPVVQFFTQLGLSATIPAQLSVADVTKQTLALFDTPLNFRNVVLVLGGPGSGKGTQCANIVSQLGFIHLSCGDLLRAEVDRGTPLGIEIETIMKEGQMVSMDITRRLLVDAMSANAQAKGFLIDGYPRTVQQAQNFETTICQPAAILYYEASEEVLVQRLLKRGETSGRADDNLESIQKRIRTFLDTTVPVVEHFSSKQVVTHISAMSSIELITQETMKALQPLLFSNVVIVLGGPGSGKGTQCANLVHSLNYVHLSTGDLLRAEVAARTALGLAVKDIMKQGSMVSMAVMRQLLLQAMDLHRGAPGYLVDGYPRTLDQALDFDATIANPKLVLYYECPDSILVERLLERGKTSGRADDNLHSIETRIATFSSTTMPLVEHYSAQNVLKQISATTSVEEVTNTTMKYFQTSENQEKLD